MRHYLLDANVVIDVLKGRTEVRNRLFLVAASSCCLSSIVYFELQYGVTKSAVPASNAARLHKVLTDIEILPFDDKDATVAGEIRATLQRNKQPIGPYDTLIAGQALTRNLVLVTANEREFRRVPGLHVENWASPVG